ncbi:MAG: hypothetical protein ACI87A_002174 [Planctomycetota bacterium]|jgi:hypothetical protein
MITLRTRSLCASIAVLALSFTTSCVTHSHAVDLNRIPGPRGEAVEFQSTTSYSFNFLFAFAMWGDASREQAVADLTKEAKSRGATLVDLQSTSSSTYWYILPPLSFFFHPVATTLEGTVEGAGRVS